MKNTEEMMNSMTKPSERLIADMSKIDGDILVLGAGGKIGASLCVMAKRACEEAGINKRITAASLFDRKTHLEFMQKRGVEVIEADLFYDGIELPECPNIIFMAGRKFGTTENQSLTWAINVLLPAKMCERFPASRFVAFSTGNVYGDATALSGGSAETDEPNPDGEYGQTCLGRDRVFEHYAVKNGVEALLFRLTYAIETRYGVLYDIARAVYDGQPVCLDRGIFSCIWQGDVCEYAIRSLLHTSAPPEILNVSGPHCLSTRQTAIEFGRIFGKTPVFSGEERPLGIYSNTAKLCNLMGYPNVTVQDMINLQAEWILAGGETISAPTHFENIGGKY